MKSAISEERASAVAAEVHAEFAVMDQAAETAAPGILDLLRVYGGYEFELQQVADYFSLPHAPTQALASDCTE